MLRQYFLHLINIHRFVELLCDTWLGLAGDPDFQFGIQFEGSCGLNAKPGDAFVGDRFVLGLTACHPLLIDQIKSLGGENKGVANKFKPQFNLFDLDQKQAKLLHQFVVAYSAGIPQYG